MQLELFSLLNLILLTPMQTQTEYLDTYTYLVSYLDKYGYCLLYIVIII